MPAVLSSWKEIASHLGKGVRTVQRWERELGLPVHRPLMGKKHIVIAYPDELDKWIRRDTQFPDSGESELDEAKTLSQGIREQARLLHEETERLFGDYRGKRSKG
jgi:hypothetical protein